MQQQFPVTLTRQQVAVIIEQLTAEDCRLAMRLLQRRLDKLEPLAPPLPSFEHTKHELDEAFRGRPLKSFPFAPKIVARFHTARMHTVGDVLHTGADGMSAIRNLGAKCRSEFLEKVLYTLHRNSDEVYALLEEWRGYGKYD